MFELSARQKDQYAALGFEGVGVGEGIDYRPPDLVYFNEIRRDLSQDEDSRGHPEELDVFLELLEEEPTEPTVIETPEGYHVEGRRHLLGLDLAVYFAETGSEYVIGAAVYDDSTMNQGDFRRWMKEIDDAVEKAEKVSKE